MTKRDTELVHQKVSNEMVKNIATENNEPVAEILLPGKNLTNKNTKDEKADLERKEIMNDKFEKDKTCKEDTHLKTESDDSDTENNRSESDELSEEVPIENLEKYDDQKEELVIEN